MKANSITICTELVQILILYAKIVYKKNYPLPAQPIILEG